MTSFSVCYGICLGTVYDGIAIAKADIFAAVLTVDDDS